MGDLRPVLERLRDELTPPPDGFERLIARRSWKHRRQRIFAAAIALVVGVGGLLVVDRAFEVGRYRGRVGEPGEPRRC